MKSIRQLKHPHDRKRTNFDQKSSLEPLAQVSSEGVALHLNDIEFALGNLAFPLKKIVLKLAFKFVNVFFHIIFKVNPSCEQIHIFFN